MAMKNYKKKRIIIFAAVAVVLLVALAVFVYFLVSKTDKGDKAQQESIESITESIEDASDNNDGANASEDGAETSEEPAEIAEEQEAEAIVLNPEEVLASAAYKDGIISKATRFKEDCAALYADSADDLARFTLIDVDKDGITELIMHDVAGKKAYYCSYAGEGVTEPFEIFSDEKEEGSYVPGAYAALYFDKNLFIKYVISGDYDKVESYLYRVNEATKEPELINSVIAEKDSEGNHSFTGSDGSALSEADYLAVFKDALGEDFGRFFLDELMIADGEYDFKTQYIFNSTAALPHMTLEELTARIGGN